MGYRIFQEGAGRPCNRGVDQHFRYHRFGYKGLGFRVSGLILAVPLGEFLTSCKGSKESKFASDEGLRSFRVQGFLETNG